MITLDEARSLVDGQATPLPAVRVAIEDALGMVLVEDVTSDVDSPPHDKAMVDGYAVMAADLLGGSCELTIIEQITAGELPRHAVTTGTATRIMTGAPIPEGADAVVMVERSEQVAPDTVRIDDAQAKPGCHIMRLGTSLRCGDQILSRGAVIRPIEVGLLAEVGRSSVQVTPTPRVAVMATGNELVAVDETPSRGKLRNSNGPMLAAAIRQSRATPIDLGIAKDDEKELRRLATQGLDADVLLLSGGVSAGVADLVPSVLTDLKVRQIFHKVRLKPGKPVWFGVREDQPGGRKRLVFGLPGNPVSSFVCFHLLVRRAIDRLAGRHSVGPQTFSARLTADHVHRGDRPTFHPAHLDLDQSGSRVRPLAWHGSADLSSFAIANALVHFPAGHKTFAAGEDVEVVML